MTRLRAVIAPLAGLLISAALAGCAVLGEVELPPDVVYPKIEPVAEAAPLPPAELAWDFEGTDLGMTVTVDAAVYEGAQQAEKSALLFKELERSAWIPDYYRAFIDEEHQEPLYDALLAELRSLRDALGLDDDRYAELIITFVQGFEYRTDPVDLQPKFPVETVGDANGDCDDTSMLAAALLAREGYDVALLLFSDEQHVTLGIRSDGSTYGKSGYALVEMTTQSLVGWVPEESGSGVTLTSEPQVIRIGSGTKAYGAGDETDALRAAFDDAVARAEALAEQITASQADLDAVADETRALRRELDRLEEAGEYSAYNARVPEYNRMVEAYNDAVAAHNELVARQQAAVDDAQRIVDGQTDRYGLSTWLAGES